MNIFDKFGFNQKWIDLGIITSEKLAELEVEWNRGEDKNTEHYRWRAFKDFLTSKENFDGKTLRELYELGKNDADSAMGGSIIIEVLNRKECPLDLLENASKSEEKFLRKVACRNLGKEFVP